MGALDGNIESCSGFEVGGRVGPTHERRSTGGHRTVWPLRTAEPELENRVLARRDPDPRGLGRDQGREVDQVEQRRLEQLTFDQPTANPDQWLVRKDQSALWHRLDIAAQPESPELVEKSPVEERPLVDSLYALEIGKLGGTESKPLQVLRHVFETAGDREAALEWSAPKEEMEHRLPISDPALAIAESHAQLIEVVDET